MFSFFKPKPRILEVKSTASPNIDISLAVTSAFRRRGTTKTPLEQPPKRGMWVVFNNKVGILRDLLAGDLADIMLVEQDFGLNIQSLIVPANQLRQAWFEEIPRRRRPDLELARSLGYHQRGGL